MDLQASGNETTFDNMLLKFGYRGMYNEIMYLMESIVVLISVIIGTQVGRNHLQMPAHPRKHHRNSSIVIHTSFRYNEMRKVVVNDNRTSSAALCWNRDENVVVTGIHKLLNLSTRSEFLN